MAIRDTFITKAIEAGGRLRVRSALNPILWLCAIISLPILLTFSFISNSHQWLMFIACGPVIAAILGFFFLLLFDRDKLQSEEYQLKKRSLELIGQKGESALIVAETLRMIEKPSDFQLKKPG